MVVKRDKKKFWVILNISLSLVLLLLTATFFGLELPSVGEARSWWDSKIGSKMDQTPPLCYVQWKEESALLDLETCCSQVRQQLSCSKISFTLDHQKLDFLCRNSEKNVVQYQLNQKAQNYCNSFFKTR